jgi:hypothetical protein
MVLENGVLRGVLGATGYDTVGELRTHIKRSFLISAFA